MLDFDNADHININNLGGRTRQSSVNVFKKSTSSKEKQISSVYGKKKQQRKTVID